MATKRGTRSGVTNPTAFLAIALWTGVISAQPSTIGGANLFAPSWRAGRDADAERALPMIAFYNTPKSGTSVEPNALIRAEPATDFALPPGVTATRTLYHTRSADNTDRLASGIVLVPYGRPPKEGWPLLAWSHGTTDVAGNRDPSLMRSLFYKGLYEYVTFGYAVVVTDDAGLGTAGRRAYLDIWSNATDVVNSVLGAHAAVFHV